MSNRKKRKKAKNTTPAVKNKPIKEEDLDKDIISPEIAEVIKTYQKKKNKLSCRL